MQDISFVQHVGHLLQIVCEPVSFLSLCVSNYFYSNVMPSISDLRAALGDIFEIGV